MTETITRDSVIPVRAADLAVIAEGLHQALKHLATYNSDQTTYAQNVGRARGGLLVAIERLRRLHPHVIRGAGRYEFFEVDDIDHGDLPLACRDLVSNAAKSARDVVEAAHPDDWRHCRIALEEVAKCAIDLMAHAERRSIL